MNARNAGTVSLSPLTVNRLGYGAMRLTGPGIWGEPNDPGEARRVLRRAVELGVNFIDTAYAYGPEVNERLIAEALHPYPDDLVIATKSGQQRGGPDDWFPDGRPATLRRELERSLSLLRLDRIDLFQLHRPDPAVPIDESVGELTTLQSEGKVRLIGISNVDAEQLRRAQSVAEISSVQNRYSVFERESDDVVDLCSERGIVFIPWFPLGSGSLAKSKRLNDVASKVGATPMQVALAWLLERAPNVLPIPGTASVAHLEENVAAASLSLDPETFALLSN